MLLGTLRLRFLIHVSMGVACGGVRVWSWWERARLERAIWFTWWCQREGNGTENRVLEPCRKGEGPGKGLRGRVNGAGSKYI